MLDKFFIWVSRAFIQNFARIFSILVVGAIMALVAVHIIDAAATSQITSNRQPASGRVGGTNTLQNCITMPDGIKVCDEPVFPFDDTDLEPSWACGFAGWNNFLYTKDVRPPAQEAIKAAQKITDSVGLVQKFDILEGDFSSGTIAYALVRSQKRYIVYDSGHFNWKDGKPDWEEVIIMAHEIGHHLNGHTVDGRGSRWPTELEADHFAGFAVSRLGGTLHNALIAYKDRSLSGSKTHPPRHLRLQAVKDGWQHSENLKHSQKPACNTDWLGTSITINGQTCRMAAICGGKNPLYRIACQSWGDSWLW